MKPVYVYALLFFLMVIEGTGLPGVVLEPVFFMAGYFIEQGEVSFWLAVLAGTLGNFVGNLIGFWIGVKLGRKALENFLQRHGKNLTRLDAIKKWFNRYGAAIVFVARWFGPIRTPVILGAGILDMPPYTYAFYSLAGSFSWTLFWQYICWKGMGAFIYWWHEYGIKGLIVAVLITLTFMGFYRYIRLRSIRRHDVQD